MSSDKQTTTVLPVASLEALAIERGWVTPAQVDECQGLHQALLEMGLQSSVAEILRKKGYLNPAQCESLEGLLGSSGSIDIPGYEILEKIAEGGMGTVYKARQISMDRPVGLKILRKSFAEEADGRERFIREARAVAKLSHPNVVAGIDAGVAGGVYYFVMEFLDGESLDLLLKRRGRLPWLEATQIIAQIARALEHADQHQIVHRDIKPGNIIVLADGTAKLADLGLARASTAVDSTLTQSGMIVGSPAYLSPEQATDDRVLDIRSDIFALGLTYFELIAGERAHPGANPMSVMSSLLTRDVPVERLLTLDAPGDVVAVITKMTRRQRDKRYATPTVLAEDLQALQERRRPHHAYVEETRSGDNTSTGGLLTALHHADEGDQGGAPLGSKSEIWPRVAMVAILLTVTTAAYWFLPEQQPAPRIAAPSAVSVGKGLDLVEAIDLAQGLRAGTIFQAELENGKYSIDFAVDQHTLNLTLDASNGAVLEELDEDEDHSLDVQICKIALIDGVRAATAISAGDAVHAEIQLLPGRAVVAVKFIDDGKTVWVEVDGESGEVLGQRSASPRSNP